MNGRFAEARRIAFGAALIEGGYALLAFWGMNRLLREYPLISTTASAVAASILIALSIYFFCSKKMREPTSPSPRVKTQSSRSFLVGAGLSAVNPTLIATWAATVATLYSLELFKFSHENAILFSAGVCLGITTWFFVLIKIIERHRVRFSAKIVDRILKGIGIALFGLGLWMGVRLFR